MLLYLRKKYLPNTSIVMYTTLNMGMLYVDIIYYARCLSSIPRAERVKARPVESNNNISDRSEAKGTGELRICC